jgi:hypothetical protein
VVKDGRIEIVSGAAAGAPGSWSVAGTLTPDGSVSLSGESVSAGRPGTPPAGQHVMHHFSGRVVGEQFTADDLDHSAGGVARGCPSDHALAPLGAAWLLIAIASLSSALKRKQLR